MKIRIKKILGYIIANAIFLSGKVKRAKNKIQNGEYILSICFHAPGKPFFESCTDWLTKNGFQFISICDLEKVSKGEMPFPKNAVVITLDDGWQSNYNNVVPVAVKNKIPVTIFVCPGIVESGDAYWWSYINEATKRGLLNESVQLYKKLDNDERIKIIGEIKKQVSLNREALTINQLKEIAKNKYISIGSHTISHPILPKCADERSSIEIVQSKKTIEEWTGLQIKHFAYPNGDFSTREINILQKSGYTAAFTVEQELVTKEKLSEIYQLPRMMMVEDMSVKENICRMLGVWIKKPGKANQYN